MKLLNLGCGKTYHRNWINIDFNSNSSDVILHDLTKGIPLENNSAEVVYHSHVLEHFSKSGAETFLKECFRVLKKNGIIRIAVPDLEKIAKEYLDILNLALSGDYIAEQKYEWILLELFDQMVREKSGGNMLKYLRRKDLPIEDYIFKRVGMEAVNIRNSTISKEEIYKSNDLHKTPSTRKEKLLRKIRNIKQLLKFKTKPNKNIPNFQSSGELHKWMYDRYSLSKLLVSKGFINIKVCDAFTSDIPDWHMYQLDFEDGKVRKPDSLYIEASK